MRGYSYGREDVKARDLANAYSQALSTIFTQQMKPYEVEILVGEVDGDSEGTVLYHILFDGAVDRRARLRRHGRPRRGPHRHAEGSLSRRLGSGHRGEAGRRGARLARQPHDRRRHDRGRRSSTDRVRSAASSGASRTRRSPASSRPDRRLAVEVGFKERARSADLPCRARIEGRGRYRSCAMLVGSFAPLLCALALGACGGGAAADDAPAPVEQPQGTVEAPTAAADLTERHFTTWFEHGGQDEALTAWVRGAFGPGSVSRDISDGATVAQRHDAFVDWFSEPAHRAAVVRAWLREEREECAGEAPRCARRIPCLRRRARRDLRRPEHRSAETDRAGAAVRRRTGPVRRRHAARAHPSVDRARDAHARRRPRLHLPEQRRRCRLRMGRPADLRRVRRGGVVRSRAGVAPGLRPVRP